MTETGTYEREVRLRHLDAFNAAYTFQGLVVVDVATKSVYRVRWINDYTTVSEAVYYLLDSM